MAGIVTDKVVVELEARLGRYNAEVRAARSNFDKATGGMATSAEQAERRIARSSSGIKQALLASAGAIGAAVSARAITGLADSYTRFTNQLKLAGLEGTNLAAVQDQLFVSAQRYGVELEGLGTLYGRVAQAGKELGATQQDLLKFTNGVAAAIKVQGAAPAQVSGALLQLSQALGGVNVRAEEYNSINEGARPILQAVANGSDRFKGSVTALRNAVIDGKVSSREFYEAFLKGSSQLEQQATRANLTIAASLQTLNNALGKYIGETDSSLSATQRFAAAIEALASNLNTIIPVMAVLVGLVGARYLGVAIANTAATISNANAHAFRTAMIRAEAIAEAQMTPFTNAATAAMLRQNAAVAANAGRMTGAAGAARGLGAGLLALAGGPIGLAIIAVAALAAGIVYLGNKYGEGNVRARQHAAAVTSASQALDAYEQAAIAAANATGQAKSQAEAHAAAMRVDAAATLANARASLELARARALAATQREAKSQEYLNSSAAVYAGGGNPLAGLGRVSVEQGRARDTSRAQQELFQAGYDFAALDNRARQIETSIRNNTIGGTPNIPVATDDNKGRTRAGRSAEDIAEERRRIEQRFADDLRDANRALLDARSAMAVSEQDLLANRLREIRQERDDAITEAERMGPEGTKELTQARVDQLSALARSTAAIEEGNAVQETANTLARDAARTVEARFETAREYLATEAELARTTAQRAEIERQTMEISFQQQRAQLESLIAAQDTSDVERQIAAERLAFLPQLQAAQREALRRQSLTPLERLGTAETGREARDPQQRREIVEGVAAGELQGLADGLAAATMNLEGFGQTLLDAGANIIEGVLAEVYQSIIVAPLADALSQGLDALFGTAATNVKTSADASAAVAATALSTSATASATALATVTIAAELLRTALLQAAAAAGADGAGDIISSIGSAVAGSGGARAAGGRTLPGLRYSINDTSRNEFFVPDVPGQIVPDLRLPREAQNRQQGVNVSLVNNTGVPAVPIVERDDQGNSKITLEPIGNQMIEGAGRSGKLKRALQKSPAPKRRA